MKLFDFIKNLTLSSKQTFFRREVETSFYSKKKYVLPEIHLITEDELTKFKENYPFLIYNNKEEFLNLSEELVKIEDKEKIIAFADKVVQNNFFLYDEWFYLGEQVNWSKDIKSNYEWNINLSWKEDYFNFPEGTDIQNVWMISRFYQGIWLGKAYLITNDQKYLNKFLQLFNSFIENNQFCTGVNYTNSEEISIRVLNVIYSFSFFIKSDLITYAEVNKLLEFILSSIVFIDNNLNLQLMPEAPSLVTLAGYLAGSLVLKQEYYGKKIFQNAVSLIFKTTYTHIYENGQLHQKSIPFHSLKLEALFLIKIFLEKEKVEIPEMFNNRLKNMFNIQKEYLREDNTVPSIGDLLPGRILPFDITDGKDDFSYMLGLGALLFDEEKLKIKDKPDVDILVFYGQEGIVKFSKYAVSRKENKNIVLPEGGLTFIRDDNLDVFIKGGSLGKGAPGHIDTFSFDIYYKNKLFISDPGTYSFFADKELRNKLRSAESHNCIVIDEEPLTETDGLFKIKDDITKTKYVEFSEKGAEVDLHLQHFAYIKFTDPVVCKRSFNYNLNSKVLKIKDEIFGGAKHQISLNLIFHPDVVLKSTGKNRFYAENNGESIDLEITSPSDAFGTSINDIKFSTKFGKLAGSKKILCLMIDTLPSFIITEIKFN